MAITQHTFNDARESNQRRRRTKIQSRTTYLRRTQTTTQLDFEDVELVSLEVDKSSIVTAIKPNEQEYLNHLILDHLSVYSREHVVLLADADENMAQYANEVSSYYSSPSDLTMIRKGFSQEIAARKMEKDLHLKEKLYLLIM